ncbi:hypothetical protein AB205_0185560 [Aquarana catesbeiana]|uniref:Uncharacterized protein n=1 Tax=Aquarana catesbeiana TaxID=8400 RepID=A0A2G9SJZ4_AQUCT|nr:hypothetical protein AB205_0185560 [Aquarana catesbeiana]
MLTHPAACLVQKVSRTLVHLPVRCNNQEYFGTGAAYSPLQQPPQIHKVVDCTPIGRKSNEVY